MNEDRGGERDLRSEIDELKLTQAVQAATMSGAEATQAAMQAGQASTTAATFAGTWSTIAVGAIMLFTGMFLGMAMNRR